MRSFSVALLILILSGIGLWASIYFTLVYYAQVPADSRLVPRFCRISAGRCRTILSTPAARVFGLPNSLLGIGYYLAVLAMNPIGLWDSPLFRAGVLAASWIAALLGVYLSYVLLRVLRVACPLCFACHGINATLALLFTFAA